MFTNIIFFNFYLKLIWCILLIMDNSKDCKKSKQSSFSEILKKSVNNIEIKKKDDNKIRKKSIQSIDKIELNTLSPLLNENTNNKNNYDNWIQHNYDEIYSLFSELKTTSSQLCPFVLEECTFENFAELLFNFSSEKNNFNSDNVFDDCDISDDDIT